MSTVQTHDLRVNTPHGHLFARRWTPQTVGPTGAAPIVLFHDSLGCVALWRALPERLALATGRAVIAYDRLGFGQSDPHPGKLGNDFVGEEARGAFAALRAQLGLARFVAFGHSVGGGMAIACASTFPSECAALITESAQAFVEDRTIQGIVEAQQAFEQQHQRDRLAKYHGDKAAWVLSAWIDTWLAPDFVDWNLDVELQRVQCPALVIHGEGDECGSVRHPERIARLIGVRSEVEILQGCGHVPHREKRDVVLERVARFLEGA